MPLPVEDQLEIQQLYARYNHAIDSGDAEGWANCFIPEGKFASSAGASFEGSEKLAEFARGFAQRMTGRHWTNNLVIEGDGEHATGRCYLMLYSLGGKEAPATVVTTGIYQDALVKTIDGWRFSERTVQADS